MNIKRKIDLEATPSTVKIYFLLAIAVQLGAGSCDKANQETTEDYSDIDTDADSDGDSDADADAGYFMGSNGVPVCETIAEGTSCEMVNLTHCCCDGNGLQTCQTDFTWSKCECYGEEGDSGVVVIPGDPVLEENENTEISFEWVETTTLKCLAGTHLGTFDGTYQRSDIFTPSIVGNQGKVPVAGNISVRLAQSSPVGEIFTVEDGDLDGFLLGFVPFQAKISGELNCSTREFSGKIYDGSYNFLWLDFGSEFPSVIYFEGSLRASYDKIKHRLVLGKWEVSEPQPNEASGGNGTWTAARQ